MHDYFVLEVEMHMTAHNLGKLVFTFLLLPHCDLLCFVRLHQIPLYLFKMAFFPFQFTVLHKKRGQEMMGQWYYIASRIQTCSACTIYLIMHLCYANPVFKNK